MFRVRHNRHVAPVSDSLMQANLLQLNLSVIIHKSLK